MTDPDPNGNKTVFRPSPLQALKSGGQAAVAPPPVAPPPPPAAAPAPAPNPAPTRKRSGGWRTALTIVFVVISVLAIGYIVLQLTHTPLNGLTSLRLSQHAPAARVATVPPMTKAAG